MPYTVPNAASATYPAQASLDSGDLQILAAGSGNTGIVSGCAVTAQGTPNMTVAVAAGVALIGGVIVTVPGGNVTITAANSTNPRHDLITVDTSGNLAAVAGTPAAITASSEPTYPSIPASRVVIAAVYVPASVSAITSTMITDKRVAVPYPFAINAREYGAAGNGTTNDTAALQGAIDALAARGGGTLALPPGTYLHGGLTLKTGVWLRGAGMYATVLKLANGSNGPSVTVFKSPDGIVSNGFYTGVLDLGIDGNRANQLDNNASHGIVATTNPLYTKATNDVEQDLHHVFENLFITNVAGTGVYISGRSENRVINVHVYYAQQYGFYLSSDSFAVSCTSGQTGNRGFVCENVASVRLVNCKAFYAGRLVDTGLYTGAGYLSQAAGFWIVNCAGNTLVNCEAQDCSGQGFFLENSSLVTLAGCVADSNSRFISGSKSAFELWNSYYCTVSGGIAYDRFADGVTTWQLTALYMNGGSANNDVSLTHAAWNGATVSSALNPGSVIAATNTLSINGSRHGLQSPTYAASFTPNPYAGEFVFMTLTGNITVNNPTEPAHPGQQLTFIFVQDGTGGRTVTWGSAFKLNWTPTTTANRRNTITFVYDGSAWQQFAAAINTP